FDKMLGRLADTLNAQRQMLSDVSHQLRTPLTVIRGHLEVLLRTPIARPGDLQETANLVLAELDHTERLVAGLLLLGRSMEADFLQAEPIDLRSFLADLFQAARLLSEREWVLGELPDRVLLADATKLRGAIWNLLDNAVKATTTTDSIVLRARVEADGELVIAISDSGSGIPAERQEQIFDRFSSAQSGGSGLGLSIAKVVTEAHGGRIRLASSPGLGSTFSITLPPSRLQAQSAWGVDP
ncbi:MAG: sensor histidine kinase, partial [Mycobacteriales bacterium]